MVDVELDVRFEEEGVVDYEGDIRLIDRPMDRSRSFASYGPVEPLC